MNRGKVHIAPGVTGEVSMSAQAAGIVLLIDGSEGSREHRRHRFVAGYLHRRQFTTLLLDESDEPVSAATESERIQRLSHDLIQALDWLRRQPEHAGLPVGVFGSGAGAAAAIVCAAELPNAISAVVSRAAPMAGLRTDIERLRTPTMLVVGGLDARVLESTQSAYRALTCDKRLEVVPRATHLFEEAGAMERVALSTADWFESKLKVGD